MPPSKRQKTGEDAGNPTGESNDAAPSLPHKGDDHSKHRDETTIPDFEYICMPRPHFDFKAEQKALSHGEDDGDEIKRKYRIEFEKASADGIHNQPAAEHKDWKYVIMWNGWKTFTDYYRRSNFCDPDLFGMHITNDYYGYGLQEIMENMFHNFDLERKKKDDLALKRSWSVISGLGQWLNQCDLSPFFGNEDGAKVQALCGLVGYALLTALADLDHANELKSDSQFIDLPLVISSFLHFSDDLGNYGIEDEEDDVNWRVKAGAYFKKAELDPKKGVAGTEKMLEELESEGDGEEQELPDKSKKDPWGWAKKIKAYTKDYGKMGGTKYDITKMSRAERARYAFDKEDPLKDISDKDLKEGNIDFA